VDRQLYQQKANLALHYESIGSWERARDACLSALQDKPHDPVMLLILTRSYMELRDWLVGAKAGKEALAYLGPYQKAYIYNLLAYERMHYGAYALAEKYSKRAVEINPKSAIFLARYAGIRAHRGHKKEAIALFQRAENLAPQSFVVLTIEYGFYHRTRRNYAKEKELLERMVPLSTNPFTLNFNFGAFYYNWRKYPEAHEYYVRALLINPESGACKSMLTRLEKRGYGSARFSRARRIRSNWIVRRVVALILLFLSIFIFIRLIVVASQLVTRPISQSTVTTPGVSPAETQKAINDFINSTETTSSDTIIWKQDDK